MKVKVEISARHLHITQEDLEELFGQDFKLTKLKELSQRGEFASEQTVTLVGDKGQIDNVRIVGPCRSHTQVEISRTDSFILGVKAPLRLSGKIEGSGKIKLVGPKGEVDLEKGVIVAKRHIHLSPEQANDWGVKNSQEVSVEIENERAVTFHKVEIRIQDNYQAVMHLDTDEANAAWVDGETVGEVIISD